MTEIEKLLAVLDLDEADQNSWVRKWLENNEPKLLALFNRCELSLADLAFRLRDEIRPAERFSQLVSIKEWKGDVSARNPFDYGCLCVYAKAKKISVKRIQPLSKYMASWFLHDSQPIHWVVASLIAKQLAKKVKE